MKERYEEITSEIIMFDTSDVMDDVILNSGSQN